MRLEGVKHKVSGPPSRFIEMEEVHLEHIGHMGLGAGRDVGLGHAESNADGAGGTSALT